MTKKLYFDEPMTTEFTADVIETRRDERGFGVILPSTFFYPTGGGQSHDTGSIGTARVVDAFIEGDEIIHILDKEIALGSYPAKVDWERRFANMQHHTGQHIFSAVFWKELGLETISSHISGETPTTIDFNKETLSAKEIALAEKAANRLVFENRVIKAYFVENKDSVPFRRPPKVDGEIRVIEIEGYDYSACGGTHLPQTGMVGMLKIVRTERINKKTRIHFVAGWQTFAFFDEVQKAAQESAQFLAIGIDALKETVESQYTQLKSAQNELKKLREMKLEIEAQKMVQLAEPIGEKWLATSLFENRNAGELRSLAMKLRVYPGMVAVLASFDGSKLSLVTACADDTELSANELLQDHLAPFNGRGGGDKSIAQGGGAATNVDDIFKHTKEMVRNS
ncbi:MAG: hypothetical protein HN855_15155 [Anaerolineae bacterium]|jgi:alanyl-tRNA synthetase|nr:hypothetical protein [Anaerolineae bacterium]MBT7069949.1 hypothetical protein [Anaerolineae bacterium]MBT7326493.1 hypothetical protein [Anaerolineae bacterium]